MNTVIQVDNLRTHLFTKAGVVKAVDNVSFSVARGKILGLVSKSGSRKSMTDYSIMSLIDAPGRIVGGKILLNSDNVIGLKPQQWRGLRGNRIASIFQDPMMTLNVLRIDTQMIEAIQAHEKINKVNARERCRAALARVGMPSPDERLNAYPHQFSVGIRQRVAIATAILNKPDLIIADETPTALDVTIQGQILFEMQKFFHESGTALIPSGCGAVGMSEVDYILELKNISKRFIKKLDLAGKIPSAIGVGAREETVHAVDGVSLNVKRGEVVGLVGESGCGKSTLGRVVVGIHPQTKVSAGEWA